MTCSCQSSSKIDQAKHISSSLQLESGRETGRSILGDRLFRKLREMINNLTTRQEEEASSEAEHKFGVTLN